MGATETQSFSAIPVEIVLRHISSREIEVKAVVVSEVGGPEVLEYRDVPPPEPGPNKILVKTPPVGIGRHDVITRTARSPSPRQYPLILGAEATGTVVQVG